MKTLKPIKRLGGGRGQILCCNKRLAAPQQMTANAKRYDINLLTNLPPFPFHPFPASKWTIREELQDSEISNSSFALRGSPHRPSTQFAERKTSGV
ncbi:hypothetical protein Mapa_014805 [Marchantia paleacea]|nr:hypothetical protein Mapa_014805 [Marchantia paleacea]